MIKPKRDKDIIGSVNMTPIIDIVFLLIIFFMLVCQFIAAENFDVSVPEQISNAEDAGTRADKTTIVTVMFDEMGQAVYAVGSEIAGTETTQDISGKITAMIDRQLGGADTEKKVVSLRADKDITFDKAKLAIAGISRSSATDIKWAVHRND